MGHSKADMDGHRRGRRGYGAIEQAQKEKKGHGNAVVGHREGGSTGHKAIQLRVQGKSRRIQRVTLKGRMYIWGKGEVQIGDKEEGTRLWGEGEEIVRVEWKWYCGYGTKSWPQKGHQ